MERVAIFAALRWECTPILRCMRRIRRSGVAHATLWRGEAAEREVWLLKTAVGERRAEAAARAACGTARFDLLLSTGCAGALSVDMRPGDLAIATAVIGNSFGTRFETDTGHREVARAAAQRAALRPFVGPLLCSTHALATAVAKRDAAMRTGAVAVEMEGTAIAAVAHDMGIPFVAVRAILDAADTELSTAAGLVDHHTGGVNIRNVIRHLAAHPGALAEMLALQRMQRAAQQSLERFFNAWLAGS
ncbi:MAG: hypothetical protein U0587_02925 [Candidatus Binatia bacterium]